MKKLEQKNPDFILSTQLIQVKKIRVPPRKYSVVTADCFSEKTQTYDDSVVAYSVVELQLFSVTRYGDFFPEHMVTLQPFRLSYNIIQMGHGMNPSQPGII